MQLVANGDAMCMAKSWKSFSCITCNTIAGQKVARCVTFTDKGATVITDP